MARNSRRALGGAVVEGGEERQSASWRALRGGGAQHAGSCSPLSLLVPVTCARERARLVPPAGHVTRSGGAD